MPPIDEPRLTGSTRRDPRWLWILAGALLVARVATGVFEEGHPPTLASRITWVPAADAHAHARESGKPILYDYNAEWCGPCGRMNQEVYADPRLAALVSRRVVPVSVVDRQQEDGHNPAIVDSLQRAHGVKAFPTLVMVDADGTVLGREEGYRGAQAFTEWLARSAAKRRPPAPRGLTPAFP